MEVSLFPRGDLSLYEGDMLESSVHIGNTFAAALFAL